MHYCECCNPVKSFNSKSGLAKHKKIKGCSSFTAIQKRIMNEERYNNSPRLCQHCSLEIPYEQRMNKFCSSSCSTTFNNLNRPKKIRPIRILKKPHFYPYGPYTKVTRRICTNCRLEFWAINDKRVCSDVCFLEVKKRCASGIKHHFYKGYTFDSTWELEMALFLDDLNVEWIQPKTPLPWVDSKGKPRKYFPDFYIKELDLYLDPKNPLVIIKQKEKLTCIGEIYPNVMWGHIKDLKLAVSARLER